MSSMQNSLTVFHKQSRNFMYAKKIFPTLFFLITAIFLNACALDPYSPENMQGVPTGAVGHYGENIGVPEYSVNGLWLGNCSGWGGGGGFAGGVALPRHPKEPFFITVKWESCDTRHLEFINNKPVDPEARCISEWHEEKIPVNFSVEPGNSAGMFIHFLPGHKVEAWVTRGYPEGDLYPGPAYPRGPAPSNPPMPQKNMSANTQVLDGTTP